MHEYNLKHRDGLLSDIADALAKPEMYRVVQSCIRVRFLKGQECLVEFLGLAGALDAIARDLYWNEESNWAEATRASVDTY